MWDQWRNLGGSLPQYVVQLSKSYTWRGTDGKYRTSVTNLKKSCPFFLSFLFINFENCIYWLHLKTKNFFHLDYFKTLPKSKFIFVVGKIKTQPPLTTKSHCNVSMLFGHVTLISQPEYYYVSIIYQSCQIIFLAMSVTSVCHLCSLIKLYTILLSFIRTLRNLSGSSRSTKTHERFFENSLRNYETF